MKLTISYRHMEGTPSIEDKIKSKVTHLNKYFMSDVAVKWTCTIDGHLHRSVVHLHADQTDFHAKAEDENLYKTFDEVIKKIESQAQKHKKDASMHRPTTEKVFSMP